MSLETAADFLSSAGMIVVIAAALQATAYLFSGQIMLRVFLLTGTGLYMLYYFVAADEPLWAAIGGTACIGTTSIYGLLRALAHRSPLIISKAHLPIFESMVDIDPGAFRKLMRLSKIETFQTRRKLIEIGGVPDHVYYTLDGVFEISKSNHNFSVSHHSFLGEISIIGGFPATATVHCQAGAKAVVWDRKKLLSFMSKDDRFRIAIEALFAKDMAIKLSHATRVGKSIA